MKEFAMNTLIKHVGLLAIACGLITPAIALEPADIQLNQKFAVQVWHPETCPAFESPSASSPPPMQGEPQSCDASRSVSKRVKASLEKIAGQVDDELSGFAERAEKTVKKAIDQTKAELNRFEERAEKTVDKAIDQTKKFFKKLKRKW